MKLGSLVGPWRVVRFVHRGGNGEVWEVDGPKPPAALKIIRKDRMRSRDRTKRFRREIDFLLSNPSEAGVLPLWDSSFDDENAGSLWYVMPLARPMRAALGDDPSVETVVRAILTVAETLERLSNRGISHRDVKPENLFELAGQWLIGDFGLVAYPEAEPLTEHGND